MRGWEIGRIAVFLVPRHRQLILRTEDRVFYLRLPPAAQIGLAAGIGGLFLFSLMSSAYWLMSDRSAPEQAAQHSVSPDARELEQELQAERQKLAALMREINKTGSAGRATEAKAPGRSVDLPQFLDRAAPVDAGAAEAAQSKLEAEIARMEDEHARGTQRLGELEARLAGLRSEENDLQRQTAEARGELERAHEQRAALDQANAALEARIAELSTATEAKSALEVRIAELEEALLTRAEIEREQDELAARVIGLETAAQDRGRLEQTGRELAARVAELEPLLAVRTRLEAERTALQDRVAVLEAAATERQRLIVERTRLEEQVATLAPQVAERTKLEDERKALVARLAQLESAVAERAQLETARLALEQEVAALKPLAAERAEIERQRNALAVQLKEREAAEAERARAHAVIVGLEAKVTALEPLAAERARLEGERNSLAARVAELNMAVTDRARLQDERSALAAKVDRLEGLLAARGKTPQGEIARLETDIDRLKSEKTLVEHDLAAAEALLATLADDRSQAVVERDMLAERVDLLANRLGRLAEDNKPALARLNDLTTEGVNSVERTVVMTGLNSNKLLMRLGLVPQPQGGPFVADDPADMPQIELAERIALLETQFDRMDGLRQILAILPLAPPIDNSWSTGGYGRRKDPFNGEWAFHTGVDLSAEPGSVILSTAPGRVTFVGYKGGYGKMIEIDHGLGVRTRYGHLKEIHVVRDQLVEFREKIGIIGNTGRSTGLHLHYEVLFDDETLDPANFLRAGKYVFKQ
ncbi:MAG: hypothetical protein EXQ88_02485 [Alphaproteobacteria bacterium]|nr:hypothetical protein [Alphaproteobacteria bacterium]